MKKIIIFIVIFIILVLGICAIYPIYNTMTVSIIKYEINEVSDKDVVNSYLNNSKTSITNSDLSNYYLISLEFNVLNNKNCSYNNWSVYVKSLNKNYNIYYNKYKAQGADYYIQKNSSINNLGMNILVYAEGKTTEETEKELIDGVKLYAIGFPAL